MNTGICYLYGAGTYYSDEIAVPGNEDTKSEEHKKKLRYFQSYLLFIFNSYDLQFERITANMISEIKI